jgi:hypothetical protein
VKLSEITSLANKNTHVVNVPLYLPELGGRESDTGTQCQKFLLSQISAQQWVQALDEDLNSAQA